MPTHQGPAMESDVVIAVMGLTGVGKSTFIKNVTGRDDIEIGHGLTSETSEVLDYAFEHAGRRYKLVDTPGFNDTFESDETITANVLQWLERSYRAGAKLNGILYLHSIAAPRMAGSAFDNLCMFRNLCGEDALKHVVLATTFWGSSNSAVEEQREKDLTQDRTLWGRMVSAGSKFVRLRNSRESAMAALEEVSRASQVMLQAQHEMINEGKAPKDTSAARYVASCDQDLAANEFRGKLRKRREETIQQMEKLKQMRADMQAQDECLAKLKEEVEKARKGNFQTEEEPPRPKHNRTQVCQCKLAGRARCWKCGRSIGKAFYHCCSCSGRAAYLQCKGCGKNCPNVRHPEMRRLEAYCIVM